jgi:hypothetical protein
LVVHPERGFRCHRMHDAILHLEPEDLFQRHKQGASVFPADGVGWASMPATAWDLFCSAWFSVISH